MKLVTNRIVVIFDADRWEESESYRDFIFELSADDYIIDYSEIEAEETDLD